MRHTAPCLGAHCLADFQIGKLLAVCVLGLGLLTFSRATFAQIQEMSASSGGAKATGNAPLTITLADALQRARINDPEYRSAVTDLGLAHEDRVQAPFHPFHRQ